MRRPRAATCLAPSLASATRGGFPAAIIPRRGGSLRCSRRYMGTGRHCVDVDECTADNGGCGDPLYHHCVNRIGEQKLCEDVLECAHNNGACGNATLVLCEVCVHSAQSIAWLLIRLLQERNGMKPNCRDINECAVNNGGCGRGFRCVNRDGRVGQVHECHGAKYTLATRSCGYVLGPDYATCRSERVRRRDSPVQRACKLHKYAGWQLFLQLLERLRGHRATLCGYQRV
jgi:hypothetical protein